jgi:hypothetical protein
MFSSKRSKSTGNKAVISWTFTPNSGSGTIDKYEARCGTSSNTYSKITQYAATATAGLVKDMITGSGRWFCAVFAMNALSEVKSNEIPFDAAVGLSGTLTAILK